MIYIFWAILSFLATLGIVDLFRKGVFYLYKPRHTNLYMAAVITNADDAENTVRSIIERLKWMEMGTAVQILLIDQTNSDEIGHIIKKLIIKFPNVSLLSS
ncbi:MAG: hypothetical protein R3Y33_02495 [Clostridia bacterium]